MKKILLLTLFAIVMASCQRNTTCHIVGTMEDNTKDGYRIFFVPMGHSDPGSVDSIEVQNGHFDLFINEEKIGAIRLDYHVRYGTEELLVITEPGELNVTIGAESYASGTPQNDALQQWKEHTLSYRQETAPLYRSMREAKKAGDTITFSNIKQQMDSIRDNYTAFSLALIENFDDSCTLAKFLRPKFTPHE